MRRFWIIGFLLLACCLPARAQFTAVAANVTDGNGKVYQNCSGSASFVPSPTATTVPTINGSTFQTIVPIASCDSFGNFNLTLVDNAQVSDGHTGGQASQWSFFIRSASVCFAGQQVSFSTTLTITGSSQNISSALTSASAPLPSCGGGAVNCPTVGGVAYQNGSANTLTCGSSLTYAPASGNQFTNNGPIVANSYEAGGQVGSGNVYTLSAAGNASAGLTIYTGTVPPGSALVAGMFLTVAGFTNSANNGHFIVQGSTATTITLYNSGGVAESHAATATADIPFGISAGNVGDARFFEFGSPGQFSTFSVRGTVYKMSDYRATFPGAITYAAGVDGDSIDGLYHLLVSNGATGDHYYEIGGVDDGTGANPNACRYGNQGGVEDIKCSKGGGTFYSQSQTICTGHIALSTGSINSGARATNTLSCPGLDPTKDDTFMCNFNGDTNGVTGYAPSNTGGITLKTWVSANTINVDQVNDTGSPITPGAATASCKGIR